MGKNFRDGLNTQIKRMAKSTPLKTYMWYMQLPQIGNRTDIEMIDISSRISSITVPFLQYETEKEAIGNSFRYFAKSVDIGNVTMEIIEFNDGATRRYLQDWQNLMTGMVKHFDNVGNNASSFSAPYYYKKNLTLYRMDDMKSTVYHDNYSGYFISGIDDMSNDYESSELMKYSVTLTGDDITHIDPRGNKDGLIENATNARGRIEELADKVGNVAEFISNVENARGTVRSVIDALV